MFINKNRPNNGLNSPFLVDFVILACNFFILKAIAKKGKVHDYFVFAKMSKTTISHIPFYLSKNSFGLYVTLSKSFQIKKQKILHHPQNDAGFLLSLFILYSNNISPRIAKRSRKSRISAIIPFGTLLEHIIVES